MTHSQKSSSRPPQGAKTRQKLVRMPHELAERVTEASKQRGISGNEFHLNALAAYLQSLLVSASEHGKTDDAKTEMEAQYQIAEALGERVRVILKAEIGQAVAALAPNIAREVTTVLTPLRSDIAAALNSGLRTIQGQVGDLIVDSILSNKAMSSGELAPGFERSALRPDGCPLEPSNVVDTGVASQHAQIVADQSVTSSDNQRSLAALSRSVQKQPKELRLASASARNFRKT